MLGRVFLFIIKKKIFEDFLWRLSRDSSFCEWKSFLSDSQINFVDNFNPKCRSLGNSFPQGATENAEATVYRC